MIKSQHTKPYKRDMQPNKVEHSTYEGPYFTKHDVNVPFSIPDFSSSKTILHCFHIDANEGELGIGYDMIIDHDLMVQIGLLADFKRQVLNGMVIQYRCKNLALY